MTQSARELVSGYVKKHVPGEALRMVVAGLLDVGSSSVADAAGDTESIVAYVQTTDEDGDYATGFQIFVDVAQARAYGGKEQLLAGLAARLAQPVLYDDGRSEVPYRWIRVDADGRRFEVFEDPSAAELRIDATQGERELSSL